MLVVLTKVDRSRFNGTPLSPQTIHSGLDLFVIKQVFLLTLHSHHKFAKLGLGLHIHKAR